MEGAARAVASACARNHSAVLIPRHRVLEKRGAISRIALGTEDEGSAAVSRKNSKERWQ